MDISVAGTELQRLFGVDTIHQWIKEMTDM